MGQAGRTLAATALAIGCALAVPAAASAEIRELTLDRGTLTIKSSDERDVIEVAAGRKSVIVSDRDGVPEAAAPCKGGGIETTLACPRDEVDEVVVDLRDANDRFDGDGKLRFEVDGDAGDDEIDGGDARDLLEGRTGDDRIDGSAGSDEILGGLDDDTLFGKAGRDLLDGGPGKDRGNGGAGKDRCLGVEKARKGNCA